MDPTYTCSQAQPRSPNPQEHEQEEAVVVVTPERWGGLLSIGVTAIAD